MGFIASCDCPVVISMKTLENQPKDCSNIGIKSAKKRHHYIPEFYLEGFTDIDDMLCIWIYEKGKDKSIKTNTKNAAVRRHFYTFTTIDGNKDSETFEDALAWIEGEAGSVFKKIKKQYPLSDHEMRIFS